MRSPEEALLEVWRKFGSVRLRPGLLVAEARPRSVELYFDATYETLELAYGSELLDSLARSNPLNGAPYFLRGRLYLHLGQLELAWRSFRRAARLPLWETWDRTIRQLNIATAESIGWPALEARRLVLGTGPFGNAAVMLLADLKKVTLPPPLALHAILQLAQREHNKGLAVERMIAAGLERWARSYLPDPTSPDQGAAYALECGPALQWLRELDAEEVCRERWVAYYDQVYDPGCGELFAIRALQAEISS